MKKLNTFLLVLAICLIVSINSFAQKSTSVYLNVEIDDNTSQQLFGIGSDGNSSYPHGQNSISAAFTQYGFFSFNSGSRIVNAYYSNSTGSNSLGDSATTKTLPVKDSSASVQILTHNNSTYAQNMIIGQVLCMALSVKVKVGDYTRTIGYHAGHGTLANTSYARVTRLPNNSNGKGVWTIESNSQGTCKSSDGMVYDNIARVRDVKTSGKPAPDVDYGRYNMPFKLTLTQR